jgi:hypothetical protein
MNWKWLRFFAACVLATSPAHADKLADAPLVDLQSGQPIANAWVVLSRSKRSFFGSLFSSADPSRCTDVAFAQTDAGGRVKGTDLYISALLAPGYAELSEATPVAASGGGFVIAHRYLQSSERAERFGGEYTNASEANAAREGFLRTPEGANYSAFTVKPDGESTFKNFRMLQVKYVEVARSRAIYATQAAANTALEQAYYAHRGAFAPHALLQTLWKCEDAKLRDLSQAKRFFQALHSAVDWGKQDIDHINTVARWKTKIAP